MDPIVLTEEHLTVMTKRLKRSDSTMLSVEPTNLGSNTVAVKLGDGDEFLVDSLGRVFDLKKGDDDAVRT